ncbi:MAG: hypothetical protein H6821_01020 [Planctomycetaceae bacterium]|nr:hypothetical protein [Planctomycetaceae bacterium]MCB9926218.1 hypothetical protein [Planctomycetaceae bacterium]
MPKPNRQNEIALNLLTAGSVTYLLGGGRTVVEASKLTILWTRFRNRLSTSKATRRASRRRPR